LRVLETPAFRQVKATHNESRLPILDVIWHHPKTLALAIGSLIVVNGR
jgi:hypothetical protein